MESRETLFADGRLLGMQRCMAMNMIGRTLGVFGGSAVGAVRVGMAVLLLEL